MNGRDHGGDLDAAVAQFGGVRADWIDLSTGINPIPYPLPNFSVESWAALPDRAAQEALLQAARAFWNVPTDAGLLAAPGASALIAQIPRLAPTAQVQIPGPTYNEHAAAFSAAGWSQTDGNADAQVIVHPNNPDGRLWTASALKAPLCVIDESFCDVAPERSLISSAAQPGTLLLKSFGKFWGLAGLRLGFAIGPADLITKLAEMLGPWPVSGPALAVGTIALQDTHWAQETRVRLARDAAQLDDLMTAKGARIAGGTTLFRLYEVAEAAAMRDRLAQAHIWSRTFPYSRTWIRLGLPPDTGWKRIEAA
ncbi:MAG: threonine-phosphate decarboxylase [Pseudomonadota bacterium]